MNKKFGKVSKDTWNKLAEEDAMFYILTDKQKQSKWELDKFLETGRDQWQQFKNLLSHYGLERAYSLRGTAIDVGCGVGRISLAMSRDFEQVIGIDVSEVMIEKAKVNKNICGIKNCEFLVNNGIDLPANDESVDFCFSYIALQHCPSSSQVLHYIREFSRVLKSDGVALFQFRVTPTWSNYCKFNISKNILKLKTSILRKDDSFALDAFTGNWVPLSNAYKKISENFKAYYLIQSPIELYKDRFWNLSNELERWKRSFWICIK